MYFISVILPLPLNKLFTYEVNKDEFIFLKPGMRVAVPFGKTKVYTGLVSEKHLNAPDLYEAKQIHQILDEATIVNQFQLKHWDWLSKYYLCSLGDVYKAALPNGLILASETIISSVQTENDHQLTDDEYLVIEALNIQSEITIEHVTKILNKKTVFPIIQGLIAKGLLQMKEEVKENFKPKTVKYIQLQPEFLQEEQLKNLLEILNKSAKQKELVLHYFQLQAQNKNGITAKTLLESSGISTSVLKVLVDKNIFQEYFEIKDRVSFEKEANSHFELSQPQQTALESIQQQLINKDVNLFHGVTASGKTEVYIKLIETYLSNNQQVLLLLPEIALTTQLVQRLAAYFGNQIAVFHSKYNSNERIEVWQQVLKSAETAKIVLGVRSALFLPFNNLGLIIVDEEHEATYKQQDSSPRYQARDAAIVLAKMHQAKVVLGSATPSLESYYNAKIGKYSYTALTQRYNKTQLPHIQLIDLKDKYLRKRMDGHFSDELIDKIKATLAKKEQVILLQNRRGYAPYIECNTCGHVPQCPSCDVSLTYYKFKSALKCHYCGYQIAKPNHCHACQSPEVSAKGFGTEQIELELSQLFPDSKIARMDQDTTRGKNSFEKIIDSFKNQDINLLVGTQMLAKGLDFENVTLVAILNADNLLNIPSYRAYERAYQLMMQVAGRAGRKAKIGEVVIQTYNPLHSTIQQVVNANYDAMFNEQIYERQNFKYSPFYKLIQIKLKHKNYETLKLGAIWLHNVLKNSLSVEVLGPEEPVVNKIRNEYIRNIMIKMPNTSNLSNSKEILQKVLVSFDAIGQFRSIKITLNVDY